MARQTPSRPEIINPVGDYADPNIDSGLNRFAWLASAPAAAAASVVGALYSVGAVYEAACLRHAGLSLAEAMPLLPIQNALAVGVGVLAAPSSLVTLALIAVLFVLGVVIERATTQRPSTVGLLTVAWGATSVCFAPFVSWPFAVGVLAAFAALVLLLLSGALGLRTRMTLSLAVILLSVGFGTTVIVAVEFNPPNLPLARVVTSTGLTEGNLVVETDAGWYVAETDPRQIVFVPSARIVRASSIHRPWHHPASAFTLLFGGL